MKATNITQSLSSRAPDEWREIPEVKAQRPSPIGQEYSLERYMGTNLCQWHVYWQPVGDIFMIFMVEEAKTFLSEEKIKEVSELINDSEISLRSARSLGLRMTALDIMGEVIPRLEEALKILQSK